MTRKIFRFLLISLTTLFLYNCSSNQITSSKTEKPIIVNGNYEEWGKSIKYVKDKNLAYGISHDENNLYICLIKTGNPNSRQIIPNNLTIWIEPENESSLKFGLKIKAANLSPKIRNRRNNPEKNFMSDKKPPKLFAHKNEIQIINTKGEILEDLAFPNDLNIFFKSGLEKEVLSYEMSIPLSETESTPYSTGIKNDGIINIKFESSRPDFKNKRQMSGLHSGERGKNRGMQKGGRRNPQRPGLEKTESIDFKIEVKVNKNN